MLVADQSSVTIAFQAEMTIGSNHVVICCVVSENGNFGTYRGGKSAISLHWLCTWTPKFSGCASKSPRWLKPAA